MQIIYKMDPEIVLGQLINFSKWFIFSFRSTKNPNELKQSQKMGQSQCILVLLLLGLPSDTGRDLARATPSEPIYKRLQSERDLTRMRQMGLLRR